MRIVFRVDASLQIGSGHVMRCLTLADELRERGADVLFICREHPGNLISIIACKGYPVVQLPQVEAADTSLHSSWLGDSWQQDAVDTIAALGTKPEWLIVDHYAIDRRWESTLRPHVGKIMAIDDLADRPHDCDLLLDQNIQPNAGRYDDMLTPSCVRLIGPVFSILRPEFISQRNYLQPRPDTISRVLVFMGGGDVRNVTGKVLDALTGPELAHLEIDIVVTKGNLYFEELQRRCSLLPNCILHMQTTDMAGLMAKADLMVGGSGSATWERCCLGLPSVLISIAQNQQAIGREVSRKRAAIYLGDDEVVNIVDLRSLLTRLIARPGLLHRIGIRSSNFVDGLGVRRVAAALVHQLRITIVTDRDSWINEYLAELIDALRINGHVINWVHGEEEITEGDCAFFLSFSRIVHPETMKRNTHNLVVHESDLPRGRGWSPLTWQVIEGANRIPITLFEAEASVDSGVIYSQEIIELTGDELIDELRQNQALATVKLCSQFLNNYPSVVTSGRAQTGKASYYKRRRPQDSQIDPNCSIADQFNLLRVVDNLRYPAWFEWAGKKYVLHIHKVDK